MPYIKNYSDKPSFALKGKSLFGIFFGVEIEVEVKEDFTREGKAGEVTEALSSFAITKHDGSLTRGFEICSSPASLDYHYTAWNRMFSEKIMDGLRAFGTKTCGMHVHISRAPLSSLQIGKMVVFIHNPENRKFIQRIAQRESNKFNNYVDPRKVADAKPQNCTKFQRHTAVNLLNPNTVEIRIFKSNLKKSSVMKNLEFCAALVDFTWPAQASLSQSRSWKCFCRFVKSNRSEYPNLYSFLLEYKYAFPDRKPNIKVIPAKKSAAQLESERIEAAKKLEEAQQAQKIALMKKRLSAKKLEEAKNKLIHTIPLGEAKPRKKTVFANVMEETRDGRMRRTKNLFPTR